MRYPVRLNAALLCFCIATAQAKAAGPKLPEEVICRRTIDDTRELVVVRGASVTGEQLKASWPKESPLPMIGYSVRVEMHTRDGGPLILGSRMHYESPDWGSEFLVLDVLADPKTAVLALGISGEIELWKLELVADKRDQTTRLSFGDWTPSAAVLPINKDQLQVRLTWDEQKRVELRMNSQYGRLTFLEDAKEWKFTRTAVTRMGTEVRNDLFMMQAPYGAVYVTAREPQRIGRALIGDGEDAPYATLPIEVRIHTPQQPPIVSAVRFVPLTWYSPAKPVEILSGFARKGELAFASFEEGQIHVWEVSLLGDVNMIGVVDPGEWCKPNHLETAKPQDLQVTLTVDDKRRFFVAVIDHRLGNDKQMRFVSTSDWNFKRDDGPATQPGK